MKTRTILFVLTIILGIAQLSAQTFEEFKKQRESELEAFKQKQEEFINRMQNEFDEYVAQRDKEFTDFLKTRWEQFDAFNGVDVPKKPKPDIFPEYKPKPDRQESWSKIPAIKPSVDLQKKTASEIPMPLMQKTDEPSFEKTAINVKFFGIPLAFDYDAHIRLDIPGKVNESAISNYWEKMSATNYTSLINQFREYENNMNLNGWAYYKMLQSFSETIYPHSETGSDMLLWVLMNRSGYKTRLAYANDKVCLLVPSNYTIYATNFMETDGLKYYLMRDIGSSSLYTYKKDYPGADKLLDFNIKNPLNFPKRLFSKPVQFTYKDNPYSLNITYNQYLINFYKDYPQVDLSVYFDAAVSPETKESIVESLKPIIINMSETQAVNFLLRFVQKSFNYEIDEKQFNKEKFFFPEEVFYYPYSDCEDRSVLFAYLVKELLNLKVVGIEYPGHVATAVNLNQEAEGDYLIYKDEKYIIADPTFENAPLGLTMPKFRGTEGKIVELNNYSVKGRKGKMLWNLAKKAGGYHGNIFKDYVFDDEGNAYLTGYFEGEAQFGSKTLNTDGTRGVFLVKYNNDGKVVWVKSASGDKNAMGFSIVIENDNDIYIAGSYSGNLSFENGLTALQTKEENKDVFVAKYNSAGRFMWAKNAGLDTYPQDNYFTYMTKYTKDGENKGTTFFSENESLRNFGLHSGPMGLLYLTGSFKNTAGYSLASMSFETHEGEVLDLPLSIKQEFDKLIADHYEKNIAGLFAVLNHVKYSGIEILAADIQEAFDKYNPGFKQKYPDIYNSLKRVNVMINDDGIISVETEDGKSAVFDKLKINDGAQLNITTFESGDAQINVLTGCVVGKMMIWFDLNYIKLLRKNGDLLIDYDTDHSQKLVNLKEDIMD